MLLAPEDAALFYRAWGALLTWVNDQRRIVPQFQRPTPDHPIDASLVAEIRKVIWAEDALREQFLAEGAAGLAREERDLIASWAHRVKSSFIVFRHLRKHSVFLSGRVYGVLGIYTPLEVLIPSAPMFVEAVLIPFRNVIITDGLLESPGIQITFGGGARRGFNAQYSAARTASRILTTLPGKTEPEQVALSARPRAPSKPGPRPTR